MTLEDRIKLAEAMGLTVAPITLKNCGGPFLVTSDPAQTEAEMASAEWDHFDPSTDANDAHALVTFLTRQDYEVHVMWPAANRPDLTGRVELYGLSKRVADEYFDAEMFGDAVARAALKGLNHDT